jgi:carboxypeptidase family protein
VNGNPVAGARVRVSGTGQDSVSDRRGRYELDLPRGSDVLVAEHPSHASQYVRVAPRRRHGARIDFSLAVTARRSNASNSADRMIIWTGCKELASLSDAELDSWQDRGVDGFACVLRWLRGMGGTQNFTADARASLAGSKYALQRSLRDSRIGERLRARGMKAYLGAYLANYFNTATPLMDWFDDRGWSRLVLPQMADLAGAASRLGFAGLAFDQELYGQEGGAQTASWNWNYQGNQRPETQVRAKAKLRGQELMRRLLGAFPGLELVAYDVQVPTNWAELVQQRVNGDRNVYQPRLDIDFWDGLSSVEGYAAIRWFDAIFYKIPHLGGTNWSLGLRYNADHIYRLLSRRFSNWAYASSRLHVTPFSWIDEGPSDFEAARKPSYVEDQLAAFRRWGTGGAFANYAYKGLGSFDYEPYADAMRRASTPGMVDRHPPTLSIDKPTSAASGAVPNGRIDLQGTASDAFAIRVVRWYDARGRFGTATLAQPTRPGLGPDERPVGWRIGSVPVSPGANRITVVAEDIKGLASVRVVTIKR